MPVPEKFKKLIGDLNQATIDKSLTWAESPLQNTFTASLENFSFRVQSIKPPGQDMIPASNFPVRFIAIDNVGQPVEEFVATPGEPSFPLLLNLWDLARRSARRIDDKLQKMFLEIEARKFKRP